jgi:hypothetical protein
MPALWNIHGLGHVIPKFDIPLMLNGWIQALELKHVEDWESDMKLGMGTCPRSTLRHSVPLIVGHLYPNRQTTSVMHNNNKGQIACQKPVLYGGAGGG